ncbi:MAG: flagellar hook-length control protein FliK [Nitrospirae bacterium]|nr:flagellar hook-length control protein FliK [Nitrospirota bacterium]
MKSPESKEEEVLKTEKNGNGDSIQSVDKSPSPETLSINPVIPSAISLSLLSESIPDPAAEISTGFQGGVILQGGGAPFLLPPDLKLTPGGTSPLEENTGEMLDVYSQNDAKNELSLSNPGSQAPVTSATQSDTIRSDRKSEATLSLEASGSEMGINPISVGKKGEQKSEAENSRNENKNENQQDQNPSTDLFSRLSLERPHEGSLNQNAYSVQRTGGDQSALSMQALPPGEKEILQQLTGWLSAHRSNELQTIRLKLAPESLGAIQIDLSVQNQQVKADMIASTEQVKELLVRHQDLLRNGLADNGLRIDQLTVRLEETAQFQAGGSMNFFKGFSQRENSPTQAFWNQSETSTPISHAPLPVDRTLVYSEGKQGRVSIYI